MASNRNAQKLAGKVAIVTASTEGIGLAIARRLCQEGAQVMISSRKQTNVDTAVQQLRSENLQVAGVVCHVAKKSDRVQLIDETIKQFGGVDIMVSNAAANPYFGSFIGTTEEAWDKIFDTNVKAAFFLCKEVLPYLERRGGGNIVLVGSIGGYNTSGPLATYSISKTTLLGMTKALAADLADRNIRVNCLAPGLIKTKFSKALWSNEDVYNRTVKNIPLRRTGMPEECAGVVSFLVSKDASYMTGETVVVSGGLYARL